MTVIDGRRRRCFGRGAPVPRELLPGARCRSTGHAATLEGSDESSVACGHAGVKGLTSVLAASRTAT